MSLTAPISGAGARPAAAPFRFPRALYAAAFLAGTADTLLVFFLPLYLWRNLHETHLLVVGLVVALPQLGVFFASNAWGAAGDQWRKLKPLVLIAITGYTAMLVELAFARSSTGVLVTALLGSLLYSAYRPGALAYVTLREPERKGHALAALMRVQSFGWFLGNITCGTLLSKYGPAGMRATLFTAAGLGVVVFAFAAFKLPEVPGSDFDASRAAAGPEPVAEDAPRGPVHGFLRDLAALYETRALRALAAIWFLTTSGRWLFFTFFPILYTSHIHGPVRVVSIASALSALAGLLFFPLAGHLVDRYGARRVLLASIGAYAAYFAINIVLTQPYVAAALFIVPLYPTLSIAGTTRVASILGPSQRAGAIGVLTGTEALSAVCGAVLGGLAGERFGVGVAPMLAAALAGAGFTLCAAVLLRERQLRRARARG